MAQLRENIKLDIINDSADTKHIISELSESVNFTSFKYDQIR